LLQERAKDPSAAPGRDARHVLHNDEPRANQTNEAHEFQREAATTFGGFAIRWKLAPELAGTAADEDEIVGRHPTWQPRLDVCGRKRPDVGLNEAARSAVVGLVRRAHRVVHINPRDHTHTGSSKAFGHSASAAE